MLANGGIPQTADEAYRWCTHDELGNLVCPTLQAYEKTAEGLGNTLSEAVAANQGKAGADAYQSRVPEERSVVEAANKLQDLMTGKEAATFTSKFNSDLVQATQRSDDRHLQVMRALQGAMDSCPKIKGGEGEYADPECVKSKNHEAMKGHVTAANVLLADLRGIYAEYVQKLRAQYAAMDAILASTGYGSKAKTQIYLDQFTAAQAMEISGVQQLMGRYSGAVIEAATYVQQLKDWERDNP